MAEIEIRDINTAAEMRLVERAQKEVWGLPDIDVVPVTQLIAARHSGGVVIGAFDGETIAGFAYGFVGYEHGQMAHHSHMLAVRPKYRSRNVGYMLKLAQRARVIAQGIDRMTWTFDPLQSLNAYFNFSKLGVVSDRYFVNFYGEDAASFLHRNGTDRLWVTWLLTSRHVVERLNRNGPAIQSGDHRAVVAVGENCEPLLIRLDRPLVGDFMTIDIPADINSLGKENPEIAANWRAATRTAFTEAFATDFLICGFHRKNNGGKEIGSYQLRRGLSFGDFD